MLGRSLILKNKLSTRMHTMGTQSSKKWVYRVTQLLLWPCRCRQDTDRHESLSTPPSRGPSSSKFLLQRHHHDPWWAAMGATATPKILWDWPWSFLFSLVFSISLPFLPPRAGGLWDATDRWEIWYSPFSWKWKVLRAPLCKSDWRLVNNEFLSWSSTFPHNKGETVTWKYACQVTHSV